VVWWRCPSRNLRAATLLSATLLAVPLALLYDRLLLLVASAWLIRDGRTRGFLPWEKIALLAVFLGSLAEYAVGSAWHLPLGPVISGVVLLLIMRRSQRISRERPNAVSENHADGLPALAP